MNGPIKYLITPDWLKSPSKEKKIIAIMDTRKNMPKTQDDSRNV